MLCFCVLRRTKTSINREALNFCFHFISGERCNGTAFGFLEFFDGIGSILGPTLGGLIFDISGSYSKSFVLSGASLAIGALFLFVMEYFRKYRRRMSHK